LFANSMLRKLWFTQQEYRRIYENFVIR
jgi:hypothetical protein